MKTSPSLFWQWFTVGCLVFVAALEISTVVREGVSSDTFVWSLQGLGIGVIIFALVFVWDPVRLRSVQAAHPNAYVASVAIYPELVSQLNVLAGLLGLHSVRVSYARHGAIVIDSRGFSVFVGGVKPKTLFSASGLCFAAARVVSARQGKWVLPCLEVEFEIGGETATFDLPIVRTRFGFVPQIAPKKMLEQSLPELAKFVVPVT